MVELPNQSSMFTNSGYYFTPLWFSRCWSSVGKLYKRPGAQEISLANGCLMHSTIMHEVLHSLGFWHEQSRPDRDQFIEVFWENIQEGELKCSSQNLSLRFSTVKSRLVETAL